jgi:hypothetical protein
MGTEYKRTESNARKIVAALKKGATRTAAAAKAGLSLATLSRWCEADAEFAESIAIAEGCAEASVSEVLFDAATKGREWRAGESWLKRRRRHEWGDSLNVSKFSDEELIARTAAALGGDGAAGADLSE